MKNEKRLVISDEVEGMLKQIQSLTGSKTLSAANELFMRRCFDSFVFWWQSPLALGEPVNNPIPQPQLPESKPQKTKQVLQPIGL